MYLGQRHETEAFWKSVVETLRQAERNLHAQEENKEHMSGFFTCKYRCDSEAMVNPHLTSKNAQKCARRHSALSAVQEASKDVCHREIFSGWFFQSYVPEVRHFQPNVL